MTVPLVVYPFVLVAVGSVALLSVRKSSNRASRAPPEVYLSDDDIFNNPRTAYEDALKKHGSVISVRRKNRLEYIVDQSLTAEVLTNDATFGFEKGTLAMLNLHPLLALPRSFMQDMDTIVQEHIISRLNNSVGRISPVFEEAAKALATPLQKGPKPTAVDVDTAVHHMMSKAMLLLILGEDFTSDRDIQNTERVAVAVASLTGIFQNTSWWSRAFPTAWRFFIWMKVMAHDIPRYFLSSIGWKILRDLSTVDGLYDTKDSDPVIKRFARRYVDTRTGKISFWDRVWVLSIVLGLIFASVHQTAVVIVWVIFELAKRPEFAEGFRAETVYETDTDGKLRLSHASTKNAERLDSFIREVMRTKGDTLSTVRQTTVDAPLGGYIVPKGSFVIPFATLSHLSKEYHGEDAEDFVGERWVGTGRPAIMLSPGYWPFGLGRWACPGRALAVAEIKLFVMSLLAEADLSLESGEYTVVDPLTVTSVAPVGTLLLHHRK
ncbi:cytochrome P450 [Cylindrobasidium torrendii FP15055 ss-10]|uniref:Cytochrome P450 n=1 Tax=Cylindrobasidium torrendii FP15055 ss-10 TaxID=1314674 RepID=A0A0D7BNC5_9AGAR|nr:cytochrome P450 [Cylindrobasidium torrendii FP15055 ss-10]